MIFHTTAVKSSGEEAAVEGKLHFAKKKIAEKKIAEKIIKSLIMFFIPYYCTDMQGALIFWKKNKFFH